MHSQKAPNRVKVPWIFRQTCHRIRGQQLWKLIWSTCASYRFSQDIRSDGDLISDTNIPLWCRFRSRFGFLLFGCNLFRCRKHICAKDLITSELGTVRCLNLISSQIITGRRPNFGRGRSYCYSTNSWTRLIVLPFPCPFQANEFSLVVWWVGWASVPTSELASAGQSRRGHC